MTWEGLDSKTPEMSISCDDTSSIWGGAVSQVGHCTQSIIRPFWTSCILRPFASTLSYSLPTFLFHLPPHRTPGDKPHS